MKKYTMTVHEGLAELKILAKRIKEELDTNVYINANKHANTKIDGMTIEEFSKSMKSSFQKVTDLINRRNAIKRAITHSNAVTEVTITKDNGTTVTYTVAELIEYKNVGIEYLQQLLNTLTYQYNTTTKAVKKRNDELSSEADRYVVSLFGNKESGNISKDVIESSRNSYIEANTVDVIDPNNLLKKINEIKEEIDFYGTRVDAALSTSNATTVIEFEV